jgi:hypothetical protein
MLQLMHCGDEPKRFFWFRKCRFPFLFGNAGKQTKPSRSWLIFSELDF